MSTTNPIYLGKNGKTFGPFSEDEFQQMMTDGRLVEFSWIWDPKKSSWKTLDQPPPVPVGDADLKPSKKAKDSLNWDSVQAILYNAHSMIEGKLQSVTETGCQLICAHPSTEFSNGSLASLNLLDPKGEHSQKVIAKILAMERAAGGSWSYLLRWDSLPTF